MKKRAFSNARRSNWAGNYHYDARELFTPSDVAEIQEIVNRYDKVKTLGSRHCFNDIADTTSVQISTENLAPVFDIDEKAMMVTIDSAKRYGDFAPDLHDRGYALHNLASLPHISVAGACATATHGSGVGNRNLAAAVAGLEFVAGSGDVLTLNREESCDLLNGAVVNLGAIGVITKITLDIEKTYPVGQFVFQDLRLDDLAHNFDAIMSAGYSVSLFTHWKDEKIDQVWIKRRTDRTLPEFTSDFFGAKAAKRDLHPLLSMPAENCTEQLGVAGAWHERLPHFKMGYMPSSGAELQSEYFVPRRNAVEAIAAIERLGTLIEPHLQVSEIRVIAGDELWMSPCYKNGCVALHFTWEPNAEALAALLPVIEAELQPFDARPHWGKLFTTKAEKLRQLYPKMPDFIELLRAFDPKGKFRNAYLDRLIFDA